VTRSGPEWPGVARTRRATGGRGARGRPRSDRAGPGPPARPASAVGVGGTGALRGTSDPATARLGSRARARPPRRPAARPGRGRAGPTWTSPARQAPVLLPAAAARVARLRPSVRCGGGPSLRVTSWIGAARLQPPPQLPSAAAAPPLTDSDRRRARPGELRRGPGPGPGPGRGSLQPRRDQRDLQVLRRGDSEVVLAHGWAPGGSCRCGKAPA
jgi:hypothetical protein